MSAILDRTQTWFAGRAVSAPANLTKNSRRPAADNARRSRALSGHAPTTASVGAPASRGAPNALREWTLRRLTRAGRVVLPPLVVLTVLLVTWEMSASSPGATLPPPTQVVSDTWDLIVNPFYDHGGNDVGMGWQILASLERVAYGFTLAALVGIALGVLVGQSTWAMRGLDPIFQVLRTVPPLAWLPLSLAAFQDANPSAIFVIFITAIWPIVINTAVGVRNIPSDYRNVARVLRLNGVEYFFRILLPAAAPYMFTGLRIGVGLAWLAIVAAEMLIGGVGIGFFIWDAWNASMISDIVLALIYVGLVGFVLDRIIAAVGRLVTRGTQSA